MENASKALIIAGAILLSILLISLGIMVYNNAKGTVDDANLDSEQTQAFNTKISQYCGSGKSGTTMNSLMDAIAASNGAQNGKANPHPIKVTYGGNSYGYVWDDTAKKMKLASDTSKGYPTFGNSATYKASYSTDANGYINLVTVE